MKVPAAVVHRADPPLTIETVELDGPRESGVRMELIATGICRMPIDPMTTRKRKPGDSERRFELMHNGESIRSVVVH
ncbi:MAG: zinc-binding alcohol dehydrogenase [Proteobacteria bacterium]|nr:zinc-binding alcohol dehydrogenase [Pseudomonadota bacterium]